MSYFKINGTDFSMCVNKLDIKKSTNYSAQANAAGDTVVDYINAKRTIDVGIIPLTPIDMMKLQAELEKFSVEVSFLNPITNNVEENIKCIIPENAISYYTIQAGNVLFNAFSLQFTEL